MNLPKLSDFEFAGKRVIVRVDLDVPIENDEVKEKYRLEAWKPTVDYLMKSGAEKIILMGHMGRPAEGERISTEIVASLVDATFVPGEITQNMQLPQDSKLVLLENLRFNKGEEENSTEFAENLASLGDYYINDAFATSHREHASFIGLPKLLPHAAGIRLVEEVEHLSKVFENPEKPVVTLLSGIKKDKLDMIKPLEEISDRVLVGGRLPDYLGDEALVSVRIQRDKKTIIANLNIDKEDISLNTAERFSEEVKKAGTIVLAGVLGKYEDEGHRQGTEKVFRAIAESGAYKVAGGGDTIAAINMFDLKDKFDWVSVGGGAMIELLTKKTLPGIEILLTS